MTLQCSHNIKYHDFNHYLQPYDAPQYQRSWSQPLFKPLTDELVTTDDYFSTHIIHGFKLTRKWPYILPRFPYDINNLFLKYSNQLTATASRKQIATLQHYENDYTNTITNKHAKGGIQNQKEKRKQLLTSSCFYSALIISERQIISPQLFHLHLLNSGQVLFHLDFLSHLLSQSSAENKQCKKMWTRLHH